MRCIISVLRTFAVFCCIISVLRHGVCRAVWDAAATVRAAACRVGCAVRSKEERKRGEEALAAAVEAAESRRREAEAAAAKERELLRRAHEKQARPLAARLRWPEHAWSPATPNTGRRRAADPTCNACCCRIGRVVWFVGLLCVLSCFAFKSRAVCRLLPQIESLREQYETGQEGWRAAMAQRAREELAERSAALRGALAAERDAEVQVRRGEEETMHATGVGKSFEEAFKGWVVEGS